MRGSDRAKTISLTIAFTFLVLLVVPPVVSAEPKIGVLTLHGVGSQRRGSEFDAKLRETLQKKAGDKITIAVRTVYYHGESRDRQAEIWKEFDRLEDENPAAFDQKIIRRLMLANVGDALAYANNPGSDDSYYRGAHQEVRTAVDQLKSDLGDNCHVAVVAHSMGCKVIFDYLCDAQDGQGIWKGKKRPSEFQKLGNLRLLISTGCSLPFCESAAPVSKQRFFRTNKEFQWVNFYDRDDILGWPLRPLGGRFEEIVQDEERNNIGSALTSHVNYWKNNSLNEEIAERILKLAQGASQGK